MYKRRAARTTLLSGLVIALAAVLLAAACGEGESSVSDDDSTANGSGDLQEGGTPLPTVAARPLPSPLCPDPQPPFVTDLEVRPSPALKEPQARQPFRDPVFGSCLVRVSDRTADLSPDDPSAGMKNEYSRVQSFNADGSRLLVRGIDLTWYLYDTATLQPMGELPLAVDPRWDPGDPDVIYFSDETRLMSYNIRTARRGVVHEFADDFPDQAPATVWGRYEGSPSSDGRYWGFMAEDADGGVLALLVYDLQADKVIARRDMRGVPGIEDGIDAVSISPLGTYFTAGFDHYCEDGRLGTDARPCGFMVYDRDLTSGRSLLEAMGHHDLGLDASGREVAVLQDTRRDNISILDLASGSLTALWPIDYGCMEQAGDACALGLHFSTRSFGMPGWALISTYTGDPRSYTWMDDQVFAIELKERGRVVRLAHTHSLVNAEQEHDYWAEPHGSVNQDFTRVLFTTNWGRSGTGQVEMYMIELPSDWPERLP